MRKLFANCRRYRSHDDIDNNEDQEAVAEYLVGRLETVLCIMEQVIQLLEPSPYAAETAVLQTIRGEVVQYLREMYGHNECSIPAVAIQPFRLLYHSGRAGRPQILVNIEQVELLRTCGYTWEEVADAL